jgi:hypothetical protein
LQLLKCFWPTAIFVKSIGIGQFRNGFVNVSIKVLLQDAEFVGLQEIADDDEAVAVAINLQIT